MEAALQKIDADLLLLDEESGQTLVSVDNGVGGANLQSMGSGFLSLNKLAQTLKMGPLNQVVVAKEGSTTLSTRHSEQTVAIVAAKRLDRAVVADSLVEQLFTE